MAELTINPETFDVRHFLAHAGYTGVNERHRNTLHLPDWTQVEADAALAAYDPDWSPPLSADELCALADAERDARLAAGFDYDFGDARGVHRFGTTKADRRGWNKVKAIADAALQAGLPTTEIGIRTDTGNAVIQAQEWPAIQLAAAQALQPVWQASWAIKDAIDAGTVTTPGQVTGHRAWPAND